MKDNIFAHWLKELCSLVFIQSIQAFIFAIVMSLIISIMTPENVGELGDDNRGDYIAATGIIAIIAIASISKLEELVKKIFGVQSNITDTGMRGGMKSLATTMMAANLAKGALDNVGKVVGGIAGIRTANAGMNKQRARLARSLGNNSNNNNNGNENGINENFSNESLPTSSPTSSNVSPNSHTNYSLPTSRKVATNNVDQKVLDNFEDRMEELKAKRREAAFNVLSGSTETLGVLAGGVAGASIGAAMGEGREILNGAMAGAGIGDKIGAAPARVTRSISNLNHEIADTFKQRENLVKQVSNVNKQAKEALENKKWYVTKYKVSRDQLSKQLENFDVSDL